MPHTRRVEDLADGLQEMGDLIDAAVARHLANGTPLPTPGRLLEIAEGFVEAAVREAFSDITDDYTEADVEFAVAELMAEVGVIVRRALRDAEGRRRRLERVAPVDDEPLSRLSGLVLLATVLARRPDASPTELRRFAAKAGQPMPRRVGPSLRQALRTRVAEHRNRLAVRVAERTALVILVQDARYGPTDEPCEFVDGKYATARWLWRHLVEHPNCTRRGRPVRLPAGEVVTLLE